jgi:ElaB/YqjD/DUF883 family membrane-anchored ribosome-binding protein
LEPDEHRRVVAAAKEDAMDESTQDKAYAGLEKDVTAAKNEIAQLSQQIAEAVSALGAAAQNQTRQGLKSVRSKVDSVVSDASDRAGSIANAAEDAASSAAETLADAIQERPIATVALALGLGFLIGVTWRR